MRRAGRFPWGVMLWALLCLPVAASQDRGIAMAVDFILQAQRPDGLFRYEHDLVSGRDSRRNNVVRQAGAAYALGEYLEGAHERRVRMALQRAIEAFDRGSIDWKDGRLVSLSGKPEGAKAGATALVLLAMLLGGLDGAENQRRLDAWLRGLLALQRPDGGFASRPGVKRASPYSDGEAWLALARYHRRYPLDDRVATALERADARFLNHYGKNPEIGFFHWGVMAAAVRHASSGDSRFSRFIAAQVTHFMERLRPRVNPLVNSCYSVEGLVDGAAALVAAGGHDALLERVRQRVVAEMKKNWRLQIRPGQGRIDLGPGRYLVAPELPDYVGGFLNGARRPQLRIDATQHCLAAMLKLHRSGLLPGVGR